MIDTAFLRQIEGFSLTTAEIIYRLPDHQMLLQSYIWQDYDVAPLFPKLTDFLEFWQANLDGPLYRVRIAHRGLISPEPVMPGHDPCIYVVTFRRADASTEWIAGPSPAMTVRGAERL